jgi:hypothetical protein
LRLSLVLFVSSTTIFGVVSPPSVGVGVVDRGGLGRLDIGDVARETILDPGTEAEKNFFDDPKTGFEDLEICIAPHCEPPLGTGETRLLLNSNFLLLHKAFLKIFLMHFVNHTESLTQKTIIPEVRSFFTTATAFRKHNAQFHLHQ